MSTPEDVADVIRRADLTAKRWEEIGVNGSRYWNSEDICLAAHFVRYLHDELASQRATIERLERALNPFADAAGKAEISGRPPCEFVGASDFENARAALSPASAKTAEDRDG